MSVPTPSTSARTAILHRLAEYHRAMGCADTAALDRLLDRAFTLTHLTGYGQPRAGSSSVIRSGALDYHRITLDDPLTDLRVEGNAATVTGRGTFDATIHGLRRRWHLAFTAQWVRQNGLWTMTHARYTSPEGE